MAKARKWKSRQRGQESQMRVRWVRVPIEVPRGRPLRCLIYARFSTDEQRRRSIKAQVEFCQKFLAAIGLSKIKVEVIRDEALSGELRSRPGIDKVWEGIRQRRWDLFVAEDSSRPYRDDVFCVELVRLAVDNGIRALFINDYIDTAEPDWEPRLKECAKHHASRNLYTSYQVKRAHEELWAVGAAIGLLKPGYLRVPSGAADDDDAPKFDQIDPQWAPVIKETFERTAGGESPWSVALWLTQVGLPKASNCKTTDWTDRNVIALVRRTDYRGLQIYRDCCSKKEHSTGKHRAQPNAADETLPREMPTLRIVEDALWYAANDAIDARAPSAACLCGRDNPQHGIPRSSRTPLSNVFRCGCCAGKMWVDGCGRASYRCRNVRQDKCWNHATVLRDHTHGWLRDAILPPLRSLGDGVEALIAQVTKVLDDAGAMETSKARLQANRAELVKACDRLGCAIAQGTKKSEVLVKKLEDREDRLARVDAQLQSLQRKAAVCAPPTRAEIEKRLDEVIAAIERMDRDARDEIKLLVGKVRAVPYRQFGSNKVVLRAKFKLHLATLLPARLRAALARILDGPVSRHLERIPMLVDLFEPSTGPKYGREALQLQEEEQLGLTEIGRRLGITKRKAHIAVEYGKALRAAELTDPFIELAGPPAAASRWRSRGTAPGTNQGGDDK